MSSIQQLTFYIYVAPAVKWKGISCIIATIVQLTIVASHAAIFQWFPITFVLRAHKQTMCVKYGMFVDWCEQHGDAS